MAWETSSCAGGMWVDYPTIADPTAVTRDAVESNALRCPDATSRQSLEDIITSAQKAGDTVGGTITCVITRRR